MKLQNGFEMISQSDPGMCRAAAARHRRLAADDSDPGLCCGSAPAAAPQPSAKWGVHQYAEYVKSEHATILHTEDGARQLTTRIPSPGLYRQVDSVPALTTRIPRAIEKRAAESRQAPLGITPASNIVLIAKCFQHKKLSCYESGQNERHGR